MIWKKLRWNVANESDNMVAREKLRSIDNVMISCKPVITEQYSPSRLFASIN